MNWWQFALAFVKQYFDSLFEHPEQQKDEFHEVKQHAGDCDPDPFEPSDF
jgi:hypothetical protein